MSRPGLNWFLPCMLLASIAGPAPQATAEVWEPDPFMLGRAQALIAQAGAVLDELDQIETVESPGSGAPQSDYARLYNAALDLERLRARACDSGRLTGRWCARRFTASWLRVPTSVHPSSEDVDRWSAAFAIPAIDLAMAICALAPPRPDRGLVCSTE